MEAISRWKSLDGADRVPNTNSKIASSPRRSRPPATGSTSLPGRASTPPPGIVAGHVDADSLGKAAAAAMRMASGTVIPAPAGGDRTRHATARFV